MLQVEELSIESPLQKSRCARPVSSELHVRGTSSRRKGRRQGKEREIGQVQERDETFNLLARYTQDQQAKELIGVCLRLPLVQPERWAAIGTSRKQTSLSSRREYPCREHCGDIRSSLEPDGKRWHSEPSVLSQEGHEPRDVRLLPESHITIKEVL